MHLERALKQAGGVQVKAADLLGITFRQFRYLAKKYQLKFNRGAVFIFDQESAALLEVIYDGNLPTPDPDMDRLIVGLFPPDKMSSPPPPTRRPATRSKHKKRKRR